MNLIIESLLDLFRMSKGRKVADTPVVPVAPLIQRLSLPEIPMNVIGEKSKANYVFGEIRTRFPKQISERVLGKIVRHYGVDLRNYRMFRRLPAPRANMLVLR